LNPKSCSLLLAQTKKNCDALSYTEAFIAATDFCRAHEQLRQVGAQESSKHVCLLFVIHAADQAGAMESSQLKELGCQHLQARINQGVFYMSEIEMCTKTLDEQELSKVGPFLSLQEDVDIMCPGAAHPANEHKFATIVDETALEITNIFKPEDVYTALMNDALVKRALNQADMHPKNYYELKAALNSDNGCGIPVLDDKAPYRLNGKLFKEFAFHHLEGDRVAVRMLTEQVGGADRNLLTQLGVLLPVPEKYRSEFEAASKGQNGNFLMKDSDRLGRHFKSQYQFSPDDARQFPQ
jgi:hypothetical protein